MSVPVCPEGCFNFDIQDRCRMCGRELTEVEIAAFEESEARMIAEYDALPDEMKMNCTTAYLDGDPNKPIVMCGPVSVDILDKQAYNPQHG